jgi:hypothetical protein
MNRISCLIIETDPEAIRQIDILSKRIGAIEVRWKTHSVKTGIDIIRMHLPEMVIVGLGPTPEPATVRTITSASRSRRSTYGRRRRKRPSSRRPGKNRGAVGGRSSPSSATRGGTGRRRSP